MKSFSQKKLKFSYTAENRHWVGDGFYVHPLLRPTEELVRSISPFILMDYASPKEFQKSERPKGVGAHPHRGFETVTFAYQGEVEHRDSYGGGGIIKPGDVQWMTAGSGVLHDEFHSKSFSSKGGVFEMVQLWVNLPSKHKMSPPKYQGIKNDSIPTINLGEGTDLRVIAGEFESTKGPASTFTPINIYDIKSVKEKDITLKLKEGSNTVLLIMRGEIIFEDEKYLKQRVLIFEQKGENINFTVSKNFKGLVLNGEPIDEPIIAHGPFVMNTREEVSDAISDFQNGKMGQI